MKIVFLIRSLDRGGAEGQLVKLASQLHNINFQISIITFYPGGELETEIKNKNIPLFSANKKGRWDTVMFVMRLWRLMRSAKPDIIHGYMGIANELSSIFGKLLGAKVVWGIRASNVDNSDYDWTWKLLFQTGKLFSKSVDLLIANSETGLNHYLRSGYKPKHFLVIPNGIDHAEYHFEFQERNLVRKEFNIEDDYFVIGIVARISPMKDLHTFIRAVKIAEKNNNKLIFVVVGTGLESLKKDLEDLCIDLAIQSRIIWTGARKDMRAIYSAFDLFTSSSAYGEGFSNAIGEAMACERICVVTDTGDASKILGDNGEIVSIKNPEELALKWEKWILMKPELRNSLGKISRIRIVKYFDVEILGCTTSQALSSILNS